MDPQSRFRGAPRRWYVYPLTAGVLLIVLSVVIWYFPRVLLFLVVLPIFLVGVGLLLFGLDLWRGMPDWRERVVQARYRYWPRDRK